MKTKRTSSAHTAECPHCGRTLDGDERQKGLCDSDNCPRHDVPAHTAGPWKIAGQSTNDGEGFIIESDARTIGWTSSGGLNDDGEEILGSEEQANARLIAAAPELLEHLQNIIEMARSVSANWANGELDVAVRNLDRIAAAAEIAVVKACGIDA